jgi:polynucleotide 5'-kinase involved in rRNA processing
MSNVDPFDELVVRLETARTRLDGVETPDDAVEALEELQETARQISAEIDRRRRALSDERGDGQLDLL